MLAFLMIIVISFLSLVGLFMISLKERTLDKVLFILVAFATGTILATALFDLIPEAFHHLEELGTGGASISLIFTFIIVGFVIFFILERFIYWFHGHAHEEEENKLVCYSNITEGIDMPVNRGSNIKSFALLNLIGDGLHNFLDGVIIMVSFSTGVRSGLIITLAVAFHEFPQEIGDFGILLYGGFTKKRALLFNFLSALVALLGGLLALFLTDAVELFNLFFLAFSGGGFLYIACTELMPEMIKEKNLKKSVFQTLIFISGIILIMLLVILLPH
ncbi:MAG: ZIP family metal transporter [Candidatus Thorarchaeota archaeon]